MDSYVFRAGVGGSHRRPAILGRGVVLRGRQPRGSYAENRRPNADSSIICCYIESGRRGRDVGELGELGELRFRRRPRAARDTRRYRCDRGGSPGCSRPRIVEKATGQERPVGAPGHLLPREEAHCGSADPRRWHGVRVCEPTGRRPRRRARAPPRSTSPAAPTGRSPGTGRGSSRAPDRARSGRLRSSDRTHPRPRRRGRH